MSTIKQETIQKNIWGWIFCIPAAVSMLLFIIYPLIFAFILSFTNTRYAVTSWNFVGFTNYKYVFTNPSTQFWPSLLNSLYFSVISTAIQTALGFILAYILYNMTRKLQNVYRVLMYLPVVLPTTVVAIMWKFIFAHEMGLVDRLLLSFGAKDLPAWLKMEPYAMWTVIITNTWQFIGTTIILYFVAMNAVPKDCLEGARIDGANKIHQLIYFIFPLTFSMTKVNLLMSFVGGIKSFGTIYLLTEGLGKTNVVGLIIFNTMYKQHNMSLSVTMSFVLSMLLAVVIWFGNFYLSKKEK